MKITRVPVFCFLVILTEAVDYRLPNVVTPSNYDIDLIVPQEVFSGASKEFQGTVRMEFKVSRTTASIKFHYQNADFESLRLYVHTTDSEMTVNSTDYDKETQIVTLVTQLFLSVRSTYSLEISYKGNLEQNSMHGFYISTYKNNNTGATDYMVLTKFEPVYTREAFPCLDEPQYKAIFHLSLTYPTGLTALANTPVENSTLLNSTYTKTFFKSTTTMSPYLVAWSISPFTCTEGTPGENGVTHSVCSRPQEEENRAFALEYGTSVLMTLEDITGMKYADYMPKVDQLAVPDFAAGGMENWGLISYREAYLLWSEADSSNNHKKNVALVIAHELTHMWFGNLVTCEWWDYTFLNEGFARFFQYFAAAETLQSSSWELERHFVLEVTQEALLADSIQDAQSLTSASESPAEAEDKFGTISYGKGAAVFRMIEQNIMGSDNFKEGSRNYLKTYKQKTATPSNLWAALSLYIPADALPSNTTLLEIVQNWVEISGHPVIVVGKNGNDVNLRQERFLLSGKDSTTYYVPLTYTVSKNPTNFNSTKATGWLVPDQTLVMSSVLDGSSWIILNNRQAGFYRVDYDSELWESIITQLKTNPSEIDVLNRAQLINDLYNFAKSGSQGGYGSKSYPDVMNLLTYLKNETDYFPWVAAIVGNNDLLNRIGYESDAGKIFISWMLPLMETVYKTVPFETIDDSDMTYSIKQAVILTRVCKYGEESCIKKSKELFADFRDNEVKVPKNLRSIVYCYALRHSDQKSSDFDFLWNRLAVETVNTEVLTLLNSLACVEDNISLKWLLGQTINATSGIRPQDIATIWERVYSDGKVGTSAVLEYIAENYELLTSAYDGVSNLISNAAEYIYEDSQIAKLEALISLTNISEIHKSVVEYCLADAKSNITWATKVGASIQSYLDNNPSSSRSSLDVSIILAAVLVMFVHLF